MAFHSYPAMHDILSHKQAFERIAEKYSLKSEEKAGEIADFLVKRHGKELSAKEFANLFSMEVKDAAIFLSFIERGIQFKERHIDGKP